MLVGVLADTHDNLPMTARAVTELQARGAELILHAGDFVAPFSLKLLLKPRVPLIGVFGNNDGERNGLKRLHGEIFEGPHRFELEGRRIVMAHEPQVLEGAVMPEDDLAVCGHTHQPEIRAGRPLMVNPGEAGGWLSGVSTGIIVDLKDLTAQIIEFGNQEAPRP